MDIVEIASEFAPLAKVGGLGDVLFGLSRALVKKGHQVEIVLPKYDILNLDELEEFAIFRHDFPIDFEGKSHHNTLWRGKLENLLLTFIECHDPYEFFERGAIYGSEDDVERFLYFSQAAFCYLSEARARPDIIHVHDWHTACLPSLIKKKWPSPEGRPKCVLTLHNLAYQGKCFLDTLQKVDFPRQDLHRYREASSNGYNLLLGGIQTADAITTVSPTYAEEIMGELGFGLEEALYKRKSDFRGILNGIDFDFWNPATDPLIPTHFQKGDLKEEPPYLEGKAANKHHLTRVFSLLQEERPLVAAITRLVPQKGPELIEAALLHTLKRGGQFILLGSSGDKETHDRFYAIKRRFSDNPHLHIELTYNEKLSHIVFAGSDLFIVPSIFEPCGLTQLIAMRYGTIPIVRKTGGLADTVFDGKNGFSFEEPTQEAIEEAIDRACDTYLNRPVLWQSMLKNGLEYDSSWDKSGDSYLALFSDLIASRVGG